MEHFFLLFPFVHIFDLIISIESFRQMNLIFDQHEKNYCFLSKKKHTKICEKNLTKKNVQKRSKKKHIKKWDTR